MSFTTRNTALLAAILLSATTMAGDLQQVNCAPDGCGPSGCGVEGCNTKAKKVRCTDCQGTNSQCQSCDSGAGECSMRDRMDAFALDWSGKCGPIGRRAAKGGPLAKRLHWHCTTKASPDSGWAPPAHMPVTRTGGTYTAYNNFAMGGYAPAAPMVYQPTDTTQLGYSYANVPQWRPNPGMIPAAPQPSNFHARFCPGQSIQHPHYPHGHGGHMMGEEIYYEAMPSSCPSCQLGAVQQPAVVAPVPRRTAALPTSAAVKPAATRPRTITPPTIQMTQATGNARPQMKQASLQTSIRPANQTDAQRVRPSNRSRGNQQQKSGGWFGLPSLRDIQF